MLGGEEGSAEIDGTKLGCRKKGERKVEYYETRKCTVHKNILKVKQLTEALGEKEGSAEVDGCLLGLFDSLGTSDGAKSPHEM